MVYLFLIGIVIVLWFIVSDWLVNNCDGKCIIFLKVVVSKVI